MPSHKDKKTGKWYCTFWYKDWTGATRRTTKRGFDRKKDSDDYEFEFKNKYGDKTSLTFGSLVETYLEDMRFRLKPTTIDTKENIINKHILPYFHKKTIRNITAADIRSWQNTLMGSERFAQTYLRSIHSQMSAIMNYAVMYYDLPKNPCKIAGSIGSKSAEEMEIWTYEMFTKFINTVDKPALNLAFKMLFWLGLRSGELLALEPCDINSEKYISIRKTRSRINGKTSDTSPKTDESNRQVTVPDFLYDEIIGYVNSLYKIEPHDKIFYFTRSTLNKALDYYADEAGVKRIRVHDLRHSHASMLIEMNQPILLISQRLGHESVQTTWNTYAHLYPNKGVQLAEALQTVHRQRSLSPSTEKSDEEKKAELLALAAEMTPELLSALDEKLSAYSEENMRDETTKNTALHQLSESLK